MEGSVLATVVLPVALGIVMLGLGLSLSPADFSRALKQPKAVVIGLICQLALLPLLGFAVASTFGLTGHLAIGLIILSLCPGGVTSNVISYLAKGDLALSVTLTAITSLVTPLTIPLIAGLAFSHYGAADASIALPVGKTVGALVLITIVPVSLGMFIRSKKPALADRSERAVSIASLIFLAIIIAGIVKNNWANLGTFFAQAGWSALALNVVSMGTGYGIALLARLRREESIAIGVEVGIQNGTTALFITGTLLSNPEMSIPPAIYSLIMFGTGAVFALAVNVGRPPATSRAAGDSG